MENTAKGNVRINGSGVVSGGSYGEVKINGSGRVDGDLSCQAAQVNGSATCNGAVKAGRIGVSGSAKFQGPVEAEELSVNGSAHVEKELHIGKLHAAGSLHCSDALQAEEVAVEGSLSLRLGCSAERFSLDGACRIGGMLNADEVEIHLAHSKSTAGEIGGGKIRIARRGEFPILSSLFNARAQMETQTIEGDEVNIEYTVAASVRGSRVHIGPGCRIGTVEYAESYEKDDSSTVTKAEKM